MFFKKALYYVKASGLQASNWHTIETDCLKLYTIDPDIRSSLIFLDNGLRIVSPAHFMHDFSTEVFLILYSIN